MFVKGAVLVLAYALLWAALWSVSRGLARDAAFNAQGFDRVLSIRAEMEGMWSGRPPSAQRYIDLSFYQRALAQG